MIRIEKFPPNPNDSFNERDFIQFWKMLTYIVDGCWMLEAHKGCIIFWCIICIITWQRCRPTWSNFEISCIWCIIWCVIWRSMCTVYHHINEIVGVVSANRFPQKSGSPNPPPPPLPRNIDILIPGNSANWGKQSNTTQLTNPPKFTFQKIE